MDHVEELRRICLSLPEAVEIETWDQPTFRVNKKIFAICSPAGSEEPAMSMKAPPGEQKILLEAADHFFYPAYVGPKGWIGVKLGHATDWAEIAELVEDSYRMTAPKRLVAILDQTTT